MRRHKGDVGSWQAVALVVGMRLVMLVRWVVGLTAEDGRWLCRGGLLLRWCSAMGRRRYCYEAYAGSALLPSAIFGFYKRKRKDRIY